MVVVSCICDVIHYNCDQGSSRLLYTPQSPYDGWLVSPPLSYTDEFHPFPPVSSSTKRNYISFFITERNFYSMCWREEGAMGRWRRTDRGETRQHISDAKPLWGPLHLAA